jgi:hypothetical protein
MNDFFMDAALGDRRYTLSQFLSSNQFPKPNITVLNETFVAVCRRRNYFVATILADHISQDAFDEAFFFAIDESDVEMVQWLLSGRSGFQPSQEKLDNEFRKIRLSLYQQSQRPFFRRNTRPPFSLQTLPLIESRVTSTTKQMIEDEIRAMQRLEQRRNRQRQLFHIQDADIHSYSAVTIEPITSADDNLLPRDDDVAVVEVEDGEVQDEEDERLRELIHPRGRGGKPSLNEVIIANITRRVAQLQGPGDSGGHGGGSGDANDEDVDSTMAQLVSLIRRYIPTNQQDAAVRLLGEILNTRSARLFATTLRFLNSYIPSSSSPSVASASQVMETWIQGFLTESVVMHSCNPGALERVVTGLRGINDPELDQIFAQAEAPQLINIFLKSTFNLFYDENDSDPTARERAKRNSQKLALELVKREVNEGSEPGTIQDKLMEYAMDVIRTIDQTNPERYKEEVLVIVEIVTDNYDTHLKGYVLDLLMLNQEEHEEERGEEEEKGERGEEEVKEAR